MNSASKWREPSLAFSVGYAESFHGVYIIVGMYEEGAPGKIFIKMAKEGSTLSGFMVAV